MTRAKRRDALPEYAHWKDTGCSASPSCLACPLPTCVLDTHVRPHQAGPLRIRVREALAAGVLNADTRKHLATEFGVSRQRVSEAAATERRGMGALAERT